MSRVSRLAQIRQRRDKGGNGEARDLGPDSKILDVVRVPNEDEGSVEMDESADKEEAETNGSENLRPELDSMANDETTNDLRVMSEENSVVAVAVDADADSSGRISDSQRSGLELHSTPPKRQVATYNSDLKADLKPLHDRAKHATDRAITSVIQRKYQESLTQSES